MENQLLNKIKNIFIKFNYFQNNSIPLCAAENILSDFCKIPLNGNLQERYIMGSSYSYRSDENFIGSEYLLPFYDAISEVCSLLFNSKYADARTLSGMNCLTTVLMSMTNIGDKILILPNSWGGHPSVLPVCERLGLKVFETPYLLDDYDLNYDLLNKLLNDQQIKFIFLAPSDLIKPMSIEKINLEGRILLYDVSQIMGLIAGGIVDNPLKYHSKTIIFGGTHKTLPGPASGLVLTNDDSLGQKLDHDINPTFLRHSQMHQIVSLLFSLLEMLYFGKTYSKSIINTSQNLGKFLSNYNFDVANVEGKFSFTHQIFIHCTEEKMNTLFRNSLKYGVTLNKKNKPLFRGHGIRLGTQEIARYNWNFSALRLVSNILHELSYEFPNEKKIVELKKMLPLKNISYTFPNSIVKEFKEIFSH
ncbi:PLP-dependent aminotransferase family protein [Akkermansia sp. AKK6]